MTAITLNSHAGPYPAADCASCQCSYTTKGGRLICVRKRIEVGDRGLLPCSQYEGGGRA